MDDGVMERIIAKLMVAQEYLEGDTLWLMKEGHGALEQKGVSSDEVKAFSRLKTAISECSKVNGELTFIINALMEAHPELDKDCIKEYERDYRP